MTNVNDAAVLALKQLVQEQQRDSLERAITINTLRAKLAALENANAEMVMGYAEAEADDAAGIVLNKFQEYLMERVRQEREACAEPGMWARTPMGNSVALTLYQDLVGQLARISKSHGV